MLLFTQFLFLFSSKNFNKLLENKTLKITKNYTIISNEYECELNISNLNKFDTLYNKKYILDNLSILNKIKILNDDITTDNLRSGNLYKDWDFFM